MPAQVRGEIQTAKRNAKSHWQTMRPDENPVRVVNDALLLFLEKFGRASRKSDP